MSSNVAMLCWLQFCAALTSSGVSPFKEMKRYLPNLKLKVNPSVFGSTVYDHFRIYEGEFSSAAEAVNGRDITDYLCETDKNYHESFGMEWITIVTFDSSNNETGCLPIYLFAPSKGNGYEVEIHEGVGKRSVSYKRVL